MTDFKQILKRMNDHGMDIPGNKLIIQIPNAKTILENNFRAFLEVQHRELEWIPEYDAVASWLENNEGRGLFLYGECGRGKSMLIRFVLPAILLQYKNLVMQTRNVQDLTDIDKILKSKIISIDDIGTEDTQSNYGVKREGFAEICDFAEKYGKLLIVSTNLVNGTVENPNSIQGRYGQRVMERIIATTKRVEFKGKSLRK